VEVGFFIHGEPLRLVFDTAAVRGCDVERANKSEMHRQHFLIALGGMTRGVLAGMRFACELAQATLKKDTKVTAYLPLHLAYSLRLHGEANRAGC